MMLQTKVQIQDRREILAYAQIIAILLMTVAFASIAVQMIVPQPEWIDLGVLAELRQDIPTQRNVTRKDKSDLVVWIVYTSQRWQVFDARVPFGTHCEFEWQRVTNRFEDPCSGARFSRTGQYLDVYTYLRGTEVQDLDQFSESIREGHIFVDASRVIHANPFLALAATRECCSQ